MQQSTATGTRLCFVHIPKTAGTAVNHALKRAFGARFLEVEPWVDIRRRFSPADLQFLKERMPWVQHISSHYVRAITPLELADPEIRFFTWVREPLACYRSAYFHAKYRSFRFSSVAEYLSYTPWHNRMTKYIAGVPDVGIAKLVLRERYSFVGLTEDTQTGLKLLQRAIPGAFHCALETGVVNEGKPNAAYDPADLNDWKKYEGEIRRANELDSELYDFIRTELYPGYVRQFGADGPALAPCANGNRNLQLQKLSLRYYQIQLRHYRRYGKKKYPIDNRDIALTHDLFGENIH